MTSASRFLVPFTSLLFLGFPLCIHFIWFFTFCHFSYMYLIENMERVCVFTQFLLLCFTSFSLASNTNPVKGKLLVFDVLCGTAHVDWILEHICILFWKISNARMYNIKTFFFQSFSFRPLIVKGIFSLYTFFWFSLLYLLHSFWLLFMKRSTVNFMVIVG